MKLWVTVGLLSLVLLLFTYTSCSTAADTSPTQYLNHAEGVEYVGMAACASCHGDKHSTFVHTGMGLSFDTAHRDKSSAQFGIEHQVYDTAADLHYYPYWSGDDLVIKEYRLQDGDTIHQLDVAIDYIVGSGQHTNSHLYTKSGYIYQAPITFYVQEGKWDLAPGFEGGNSSRFSRVLNAECISCHNAMPKLADNSDFKFTEIGQGIDCERCHGPGELHVEERLQGKGVDTKVAIDPTIVNPRKLTWERQIDLCQRCHLQGLNMLKDGKKFTDYKPGMVLSDIFDIYLPEFEGDMSDFDMANHSQRFQMSKCFTEGNKENLDFTCISCHNPHLSVKITGKEVYNTACKNCHQTKKCTETIAKLDAVENNCVSCHMPASGSEDIPHVSVHDHYIRVPSGNKSTQELQKLVGLYAVNNAAPTEKEQIAAYLEYWEKFDKNPFFINKAGKMLEGRDDMPKQQLKYYYLKMAYDKAVKVQLDEKDMSAWEHFMLGFSYKEMNIPSLSIYHYEQAYAKDPTHPTIAEQLLLHYAKAAEVDKGVRLGQKLEQEFPQNGKIKNALAKLFILKGNSQRGDQLLAEALVLEPDNLEVWSTYLNSSAMKKDRESFEYWLKKIQKASPTYLDQKQIDAVTASLL